MRGNNVTGIIFSNVHDELVRELTDKRTMGSVPFGGRYRLIDFTLSNMVNSGINRVGVIAKRNYQSLMNHLGSGKEWDLSRRHDGLFILPPFGNSSLEFRNRIESLYATSNFLKKSNEEYVLLSDCDVVCNIDFKEVINNHMKNNVDITLIYKRGKLPENPDEQMVLSLDANGKIRDILIDPKIEDECSYAINIFLIKKNMLLELVSECISKNQISFERDIIQKNVDRYKIYGYEARGFTEVITSIGSYFEANMELMSPKIRRTLFCYNRPIYTKIRDDMPSKYGLGASINNSLIANGCIIDGEVTNSVLFRGVHIGKGVKVSNCVIMQDTVIEEGCKLDYVISDKDVVVKNSRELKGFKSYPMYINKASVV